ncbi:MAG: sigma-70 family RNA polymerase sigma factor [Acidobacteriota bacterium]
MKAEDFIDKFNRAIEQIYSQLGKRYCVSYQQFAAALQASVEKYLYKGDAVTDKDVQQFLANLNVKELCLALACASGDESAWDDFIAEYRGFMQGIARQLTANETTAEELVEIAWADLYGLREVEGKRMSKFASYSGRGSLKGWLRAVLFQLSVDHHRRQGRLLQPDENTDFDRLTTPVSPPSESSSNRFRNAIEQALAQAFRELAPKMKLMLSYYYYDNLTLKQIGQLFHVHEATASRWLQKAQKDVRQAVEKILQRDYKFNQAQINECLSLAAESDEIGVRSLLVEAEPPTIDRGS